MRQNRVNLGDEARHIITGFSGIVIALTEWLNGCVRVTVQSRELKDGKTIEAQSFDLQEVEVTQAGAVAPIADADAPAKVAHESGSRSRPGGPRPEPTRRNAP